MSQRVIAMKDLDLSGKRVLIREDFNVPVKDGKVASDARLIPALPTIRLALEQNAKVLLMSHRGRPQEGVFDEGLSMQPVADYLSDALGQPVRLVRDWQDGIELNEGDVVLLENVRFNEGEGKDAPGLAKAYAALCDVFVMDAFGTAHRAQASTHGVAQFAPIACAGPLLMGELDALGKVLDNPARPMVAIVGGSKVSTKLTVLDSLSKVVDQLIVGGGIANTFIAAEGHSVGQSLYEDDLIDEAKRLSQAARERGGDIPVPKDVVTGIEFSEQTIATLRNVDEVANDEMIFDVGPKTRVELAELLKSAGTIVWNGPLGVFEFDQFGEGTKALAHAIAESDAFTVAGGGDTLAAIDKYGVSDKLSYISTGGGAFLEFLEGKTLPAIAALTARAQQ